MVTGPKTMLTRYHELIGIQQELEGEIKHHENRIKDCQRRLKIVVDWKEELAVDVCTPCNGHGRLREHIAQDDSRLVKCGMCRGTGLKNPPPEEEEADVHDNG